MSDRAPTYRGPALYFDMLRLVALREGVGIEETLGVENKGEVLIRAPAHVHLAHATLCCWGKLSANPSPARGDVHPPCQMGLVRRSHRPKATDGALEPLRREYI